MSLAVVTNGQKESIESEFQKGVKHLCERGITRIPSKYILPVPDQPNSGNGTSKASNTNLKLPIIDFAKLRGSNRSHTVNSLRKACQEYGFFQVYKVLIIFCILIQGLETCYNIESSPCTISILFTHGKKKNAYKLTFIYIYIYIYILMNVFGVT